MSSLLHRKPSSKNKFEPDLDAVGFVKPMPLALDDLKNLLKLPFLLASRQRLKVHELNAAANEPPVVWISQQDDPLIRIRATGSH